ncbi:TRAP transporter small permease [Clostridium formicaceticum]|uniref:C4-dicarboxylate ABC transporter permease n=1 Tax=Clostridium formicaceticum TaxID=1497 RepID=A0AAC9RKG0_9CLOT|nr:TRAP transporter small permease [Clostridium formicaceticum]AOY74525.1 C4-dicarboxylate ABC transporter permease [Clostridium formicaceticum]ARE88881.1 Sialic acid TRAP transporter permease protein SiaT [Clostridium formicaceticum]
MNKLNHVLNHIEEYIASSLLIFTSFLVFAQVLFRYQFNYSIYWSEEVARYLIVWFIFIGSSIAVREKAHVSVDAVVTYLPERLKKVFAVLSSVISIVFSIMIIIAGWGMILNALKFDAVSASLRMPLLYPYLAIPVGSFLMMIRFIQELWGNIKKLISHSAEEGR